MCGGVIGKCGGGDGEWVMVGGWMSDDGWYELSCMCKYE